MPDKEALTCAYTFRQHVFAYFGSAAACVSDGGSEWKGAFSDMLLQLCIQHRVTSPNHTSANGAVERVVQVVKRSLRKYIAGAQRHDDWDLYLPTIMLAYNCSVQKSTRLSPCYVMYGRQPVLPAAARAAWSDTLDLDPAAEEVSADQVLQRARLVDRLGVVVGNNMAIAQTRDQVRYAKVRSGAYHPSLRVFSVGDLVYARRPGGKGTTLDMEAEPEIFKVMAVSSLGVAKIVRPDGIVLAHNVTNLTPCHLPSVPFEWDFRRLRPREDHPCHRCNFAHTTTSNPIVMCDTCPLAFHLQCLEPALTQIPAGAWQCEVCVLNRVPFLSSAVPAPSLTADLTPLMMRRHAEYSKLHGRFVRKVFSDQPSTPYYGVVHYLGPQTLGRGKQHPFGIRFHDGEQWIMSAADVHSHLLPDSGARSKWPVGIPFPAAWEVST